MIRPETWRKLEARLTAAEIYEADLEEHFVRSSGRGGQNVNKVATCVVLRHRPSGLMVKCQKTRTQADNRYFAREILLEKFLAETQKEMSETERERYRIRKQKKRRSRRTKQQMVESKRRQSSKKEMRRKPEF